MWPSWPRLSPTEKTLASRKRWRSSLPQERTSTRRLWLARLPARPALTGGHCSARGGKQRRTPGRRDVDRRGGGCGSNGCRWPNAAARRCRAGPLGLRGTLHQPRRIPRRLVAAGGVAAPLAVLVEQQGTCAWRSAKPSDVAFRWLEGRGVRPVLRIAQQSKSGRRWRQTPSLTLGGRWFVHQLVDQYALRKDDACRLQRDEASARLQRPILHGRCRSLRKLASSFGRLMVGLGAEPPAWPPISWRQTG